MPQIGLEPELSGHNRSSYSQQWADHPGAPLLSDPELKAIADKNSTTVATLLISYQVCRGCIVLPKSVTKQRITDNLKVIPLSEEDVKTIDAMAANGKQKRVNTPSWGWDLGFDDWYGPKA